MIAVIFEVKPAPGRAQDYLSRAADLRPMLEQFDGFISVERFQSLSDPDKILSLSFFRNEKVLEEWRALKAHREAQRRGRCAIFADYRLRIAAVIRDYGKFERAQAPADSKKVHDR